MIICSVDLINARTKTNAFVIRIFNMLIQDFKSFCIVTILSDFAQLFFIVILEFITSSGDKRKASRDLPQAGRQSKRGDAKSTSPAVQRPQRSSRHTPITIPSPRQRHTPIIIPPTPERTITGSPSEPNESYLSCKWHGC